jgi:hypothetical protein
LRLESVDFCGEFGVGFVSLSSNAAGDE